VLSGCGKDSVTRSDTKSTGLSHLGAFWLRLIEYGRPKTEGIKRRLRKTMRYRISRFDLPKVIMTGTLTSRTRDLFLNVVLTLRSPREVLVSDFELVGVRDG